MENLNIKLNSVGKVKLEKLAIQDIEQGINVLKQKQAQELSNYEDKYKTSKEKNSKAIALFTKFVKAHKESKDIEDQLEKMGFDISTYNDTPKLKVHTYGTYTNPEYNAIREKWNKKIEAVQGLKREIVIGLYTTGAEAQNFLKDLASKLETLLK